MNLTERIFNRLSILEGALNDLQRAPASAVHVSTAAFASPPTLAQLTAAFGAPAAVGKGFIGFAGSYLVYSDGTSYRWVLGTAAV